jgi:hypothetical protein
MTLLDHKTRAALPPLCSTEKETDPIARVKFFTPWSGWTWYGIEFDGQDEFFGWVVGLEAELGYFSLAKLESLRGPGGLRVERDLCFKPTALSRLRQGATA